MQVLLAQAKANCVHKACAILEQHETVMNEGKFYEERRRTDTPAVFFLTKAKDW
jgi:hypothetical protein